MSHSSGATCRIANNDDSVCAGEIEAHAPLELCSRHLLAAYDWVARDVGVTDLLPSPCLACGSRLGVRYPSGWLCALCEWRVGDIPDRDMRAVRVDVVYYIRLGDRIKIGTSGNPRSRIASLPHDEVLAFELGGRSLEQRRHAQFAAHRLGASEWFAAHADVLAHVRDVADGVEDPWERYGFWISREIALHG
jgi:hypothetical protein